MVTLRDEYNLSGPAERSLRMAESATPHDLQDDVLCVEHAQEVLR